MGVSDIGGSGKPEVAWIGAGDFALGFGDTLMESRASGRKESYPSITVHYVIPDDIADKENLPRGSVVSSHIVLAILNRDGLEALKTIVQKIEERFDERERGKISERN